MKIKTLLVASLFAFPAFAETCENYGYTDGAAKPEEVQGGVRIIATGSATVNFDDAGVVRTARIRANAAARTYIAKFLNETINNDESIKEIIDEATTMKGPEKQVLRQETLKQITAMRGQSAALLKGVVNLGECYTPGREIRVTVGMKPETIAAAGKLNNSIQNSGGQTNQSLQSNGQSASPSGQTMPLTPVPGYNDNQRINKF